MSQETIERSFEVGSPAKLKLSNIRGSIDIQVGEPGVITITAVKHVDSGDEGRTEIKIEQEDDGQVTVKTDFQNQVSNWFGINKPCKVDYTVHMPKDSELRANGVSSKISIQGLNGLVDINSVSGAINLSDLSGSLKIGAVSGSIVANNLSGELDSNSVSGSIRVMGSRIAQATLKTVSGNIVLQTPLENGPYTFKSVSGMATLIIPEDSACTASIHSISGGMRTSLPITSDHRHGSRGSIEIQGGGVEVSHHCVSGSLRIVTAEGEKIHEQKAAAAPPVQPKNQMEILQKIQNGELSVEDALKELNV